MIPIASNRYTRIADDLRHRIATEFSAGDRLPAETELMTLHGVSRPTVREALATLENEGLIVRHHGRGNFVRQTFGQVTYPADGMADGQAAVNAAVDISVSHSEVQANARLAALLRVAPATRLTEYVYLSHCMAIPCSVARVYVPCSVADIEPLGSSRSPLGDDIQDRLSEYGVEIAETVSRVTARLPDAEEAWTLRIGARTAVLAVERVSTDASGRVVEATLLVLPGHSSQAVFAVPVPARDLEGTG
ncbi:GntR family transcriptional regulator [Streptomyces sp. NPDC055078]